MKNELTFEAFMTATDYDRPAGNVPRHAHEWFQLYQIATEQVKKYGFLGEEIPKNSRIIFVNTATISNNKERGYRGILGNKGTFQGIDFGNDRFFNVISNAIGILNPLILRNIWWRYFIILEDSDLDLF